jgi:hypothetical protein
MNRHHKDLVLTTLRVAADDETVGKERMAV